MGTGKHRGENHCFRANKPGRGAHRTAISTELGAQGHRRELVSRLERAGGRQTGALGSTGFLPEKFPGLGLSSPDVMGYFFGEIPFFF